jgi:hypothetical protein
MLLRGFFLYLYYIILKVPGMSTRITLSQITTEIAAHLGKELDEPFKRLLADKVHAWRGTLIRRTLQEKPGERVHFKQTIYVPLLQVNPVPACALPDAPVCDVMRSADKIPSAVRTGILYDFVGSIDGNTPFRLRQPGIGDLQREGKYSKALVEYDTINRYLEVYGATGLPLARVDGVFESPDEVAIYNCNSTATGCDSWNEPYPVSQDIKQAIVECILKVDYGRVTVPSAKEIEVNPQNQEHAPDGK